MSTLRFKVSELESGHQRIKDIIERLTEVIAVTSKESQDFSSIQSGEWAEAQVRASVNIETNARIFNHALERLDFTFTSLVSDAGDIKKARDALLDEAGVSNYSKDEVICDTEGKVTDCCNSASKSLSSLINATSDAADALKGLRGSTAVSNALSMLAGDLSAETEKVDSISSAWSNLQSSATSFESTYSGSQNSRSLDKSMFIDDGMIRKTHDVLAREYSESGAAMAQDAAHSITSSLYYKYGKKTLGVLAKTLGHADEFKPIGMYGAWVSALASGDKGAFLINLVKPHPDNDHFFDRAFLAAGVSYTGLKTSITGSGTFGSRFMDELKGSGVISEAREAYKSFRTGGGELKAYFSNRFGKNMSDAADGAEEAVESFGSSLDDAAGLGSGAGKIAKGAGKALGFVSDVVSLADTFQKSREAYETTSGDRAQKSAAAVVEAGEGLAKWGVGKAAGALVGACFGGPVGAIAGMAIGCGVDFLLDKAQEAFDGSQMKQDLINGVATLERGSPNPTYAYAPQ
ncbi:hypothetical protein [Tractidigestivibacter sp.]|uniref:hypothetical protein n=2 Tax=Tractidigestivibacter sp. TaxID=2847320 RepID=UPI002A91985C|nr:hypothetical protein [Tractidigestivibacter sp.]MCI6274483.1 hypothetical protein [Coriobacteriaceae bacterium]MDY5271876.1 hypothetical protein [Tractidigestivibacter sp.]